MSLFIFILWLRLPRMMKYTWIFLILALFLAGCASSPKENFITHLDTVILNHDDPDVVLIGIPAHLITLDSLILENPDNSQLLLASALLNNTYANLFSKNLERAMKLSSKAKKQSRLALCQRVQIFCNQEATLQTSKEILASVDKDDIKYLYAYGSALATWIRTHKSSWEDIAQVPHATAIMKRVIRLDETFEWGRGHLFLGIIHSQLPAALGGKPKIGLAHFKKAIEISGGKDLIAKVELARNYARLVFDQALHNKVLNEVLAADTYADKLTLSNVLAQRTARELLATSDKYFDE